MKETVKSLREIVEVETGLHLEVSIQPPSLIGNQFCKTWGISKEELDNTPETLATVAYTR